MKLSEVDSMLGNDVNPPYHFCQNHQSTLELDSTVSRNSNSVVDNFSICQIDFFTSMQYLGQIKDSLDMTLIQYSNPRIEVSNLRYLQSLLAKVTFFWYSL